MMTKNECYSLNYVISAVGSHYNYSSPRFEDLFKFNRISVARDFFLATIILNGCIPLID